VTIYKKSTLRRPIRYKSIYRYRKVRFFSIYPSITNADP